MIFSGVGCATRPNVTAEQYLATLEADVAVVNNDIPAGSDAPDAPMTGLPPLPDGRDDSGVDEFLDSGVDSITIQPDCLLMINVAEDPSLDGSYTVNNLGAVQLKYVGPVFLFNKTEREAARKIEEVLKTRNFSKANVKVRILRASYDSIKIVGAIVKPGIVRIGAGDSISLNDLLLRAGGLNVPANKVKVSIVKGGLQSPLSYSLAGEDYYLIDDEGIPKVPSIRLRNNDLIRVIVGGKVTAKDVDGGVTESKNESKTLLVLGEVRRKGFITFGPTERCTMMNLIFKMGSLPPYAKTKAIRVIRKNDAGEDVEFVVNAKRIMKEGNPEEDFQLEDGDRVIVPARRISLF
ncbi:MAG: polysaccharide biosynthesis/export family protein [Kiritimatiellae bacterium]|nr:polysaccharide biosynthesis/export family protein [Kiritimatiellia bacterium]